VHCFIVSRKFLKAHKLVLCVEEMVLVRKMCKLDLDIYLVANVNDFVPIFYYTTFMKLTPGYYYTDGFLLFFKISS